jgi:hypothetical protein
MSRTFMPGAIALVIAYIACRYLRLILGIEYGTGSAARDWTVDLGFMLLFYLPFFWLFKQLLSRPPRSAEEEVRAESHPGWSQLLVDKKKQKPEK